MFTVVLFAHSLLRLVLLALGVLAISRCDVRNPLGAERFRWSRLLLIATDVQLLLGLVLFVGLSPIASVAWSDLGAVCEHPLLRYWMLQHTATMLLPVVLVHVGFSLAKKARLDPARVRPAVLCQALALLIVAVFSPWPCSTDPRPLLPLLFG